MLSQVEEILSKFLIIKGNGFISEPSLFEGGFESNEFWSIRENIMQIVQGDHVGAFPKGLYYCEKQNEKVSSSV